MVCSQNLHCTKPLKFDHTFMDGHSLWYEPPPPDHIALPYILHAPWKKMTVVRLFVEFAMHKSHIYGWTGSVVCAVPVQ